MAIGPHDVRKLTSDEIIHVERLEKEIDACLRAQNGRRGKEASFSSKEIVNQTVLDELASRYRAAGWKEVNPTLGTVGFAIRFANPADYLD